MLLILVIIPSSKPAKATIGLIVDPGGYKP